MKAKKGRSPNPWGRVNNRDLGRSGYNLTSPDKGGAQTSGRGNQPVSRLEDKS